MMTLIAGQDSFEAIVGSLASDWQDLWIVCDPLLLHWRYVYVHCRWKGPRQQRSSSSRADAGMFSHKE
jgi:hypothetical protein